MLGSNKDGLAECILRILVVYSMLGTRDCSNEIREARERETLKLTPLPKRLFGGDPMPFVRKCWKEWNTAPVESILDASCRGNSEPPIRNYAPN